MGPYLGEFFLSAYKSFLRVLICLQSTKMILFLTLKCLETGGFAQNVQFRRLSDVKRVEKANIRLWGHLGALKTPSMSVEVKVLDIMLHLPSS